VSFGIAGAAPVRLALTVSEAQVLAKLLTDHINWAAGTQINPTLLTAAHYAALISRLMNTGPRMPPNEPELMGLPRRPVPPLCTLGAFFETA